MRPAAGSAGTPGTRSVGRGGGLSADQWLDSDRTLTTAFGRSKKTTAIGGPARPVDGALTPGIWTVELTTVVDPRVDTSTHPSSLDPALSFTGFADAAVAAVAREVAAPGDLVLVIGEDYVNGPTTRGSTPSVPGSLLPTPYLFSSAGLAPHAGTDGVFDANEIAMLAQTMTHELGHFMGLSHVVEIGYDQWDALDDTPTCLAWDECESLMDHNLLYPHVNCDGSGDCIVNDQLTPDQVGMLHRFVGVL